jgi:PAS domain S-box-containing protein
MLAGTNNEKILIVDDVSENLSFLTLLLTENDFQVITAKNGEEALETVKDSHPDLIILNIKLHGISGFDVCARIKADKQTQNIPVIFMNDLNEINDIQKGFDVGGSDYIIQPFKSSSVIARIYNQIELIRLRNSANEQSVELQKTNSRLLLEIEEKLRSSEEKFRNIFEHSANGISITTLDGRIHGNKAFADLVGYSTEELANCKWEIFTHPDDIEPNLQITKSILAGKIPSARWEKRYIHKNGQIIWVDITTTLEHDKNNKPDYFVTSVVDITERKKAEEEINNFLDIIDLSLNEIYMFDQQTLKFIYINKGALNNLGYTLEEIKNFTPLDLKTEYTFQTFKELLHPLIAREKERLVFQTIHRRKNGSTYPIEVYLQLMTVKNNKVFLAVINDITERKKTEENLEWEQYLIQLLLDLLPNNIYFKDRNSKFIRISNRLARLFKLNSPLEAVGKSDFDFFTEEHARQAFEDEQEIMRTGQTITKEEKETWAENTNTWVSTTKLPLRDKDGNIIGTFGISMDITSRKLAEIELKEKSDAIEAQNEEYYSLNEELIQTNEELVEAKDRAEQSDRLKTAFLQNLSHEIRTPMNGILGFADLLKNTALSEFKQQEFIRSIEKSGQRLLDIINDIVIISKIETDQIDIKIQKTNVKQLLENLHSFFNPGVEAKNLRLSYLTDLSDELSIIETDSNVLTQVLSNLIKNAIVFTKFGSIDFGCFLKDDMLEFFVQDTGIGIESDIQQIIFERFRQVEIGITRNYEGAGLGLAISKAYIEKLGGRIWVESKPGKGSTFFFNIPYTQGKPVKIENSFEPITGGQFQDVKILIVEDDELCMMLLKEMLEKEMATLLFANNGREALEMVKTIPRIQIVLMDLKMPVMDGFEATKQIKRINPHLPVIAQSAYAFSDDSDKARIAGCDDFIEKPVKKELLYQSIKKQLKPS